MSIVATCTKADAQCDKLTTVVSRIIVDNICNGRRSTDDFAKYFALSVHRCAQHDVREAARRAGPSATTDTCHYHGH